jgi:hypothetical protein
MRITAMMGMGLMATPSASGRMAPMELSTSSSREPAGVPFPLLDKMSLPGFQELLTPPDYSALEEGGANSSKDRKVEVQLRRRTLPRTAVNRGGQMIGSVSWLETIHKGITVKTMAISTAIPTAR